MIRELQHQELDHFSDLMTVFTDGSSLDNPHGPAGWAWYLDEDRWASGGTEVQSNNWAELTAILQALLAVPLDIPFALVSDSRYALGSIFQWSPTWRAKGWYRAGRPIAHAALVGAALDRWEARTADTYWTHVRGHGKDRSVSDRLIHGNKQADLLATRVTAALRNGHPIPTGYSWEQL